MTQHTPDFLQISRYISEIDSLAKSKGIKLSVRTDFDHLWELCKGLPGKPVPITFFNPELSDIGPENAFWIEGTNARGEVIHVQAARCYDLSDSSLADQIDSLTEHYVTAEMHEQLEDLKFCQAPAAKEITGKVCYHGEIWLRGGANGYRGQGLSSSLPRLILALALAKWSPDYIWGFGHSWLVERGIPQKYGYKNVAPKGAYLAESKFHRPIDSWIMWSSQPDLISLTHHEERVDMAVGMGY